MTHNNKAVRNHPIATLSLVVCIFCAIRVSPANTKSNKSPSWARFVLERKNLQEGYNIDFSPNGKLLATGNQAIINLWSTKTWNLKRTIRAPKDLDPAEFAFSPDSKHLNICMMQEGNGIQVWDVETGKRLRVLPGFRKDVSFSPDGSLIAGYAISKGDSSFDWNDDGIIRVWDTRTGRRLRSFAGPRLRSYSRNNAADSFFFSPDNRLLAAAGSDQSAGGVVQIWNIKTGKLVSATSGKTDAFGPVVFSPNGKTFATAGVDPGWKYSEDPPPPGEEVRPATDSGVPVDYAAKLWDIRTGKLRRILKGWTSRSDPYTPVAFMANGRKVIYRTETYTPYEANFDLLDIPTGKKMGMIRSSGPMALSPDGKTVVTAGETLKVWAIK